MEARDFLQRVLPDDGTYICMSISKKRGVRHTCTTDIETVLDRSLKTSQDGGEAYFALATFNGNQRLQSDAKWLKCLFLDLDVGAEKPFRTKGQALAALKPFCETIGFPAPLLVDSGYGLHAYWPFEEKVDKDTWQKAATRLKQLCVHFELKVDYAVPADAARVLRVPGTNNYKRGEPAEVRVRAKGGIYPFAVLKEALDEVDVPPPREFTTRPKGPVSAVTSALMGNKQSSFKKIARKAVKGTGCNFIKYALKNRTTLEEPQWRAALSIAWNCEEGEEIIHDISKGHPGYSREDTIRKAEQTKGPYTCRVISELNPAACAGCPLDIGSPIQTGSYVARRGKADEKPAADLFASAPVVKEDLEAAERDSEDVAPNYKPPFPYYLAERGIYIKAPKAKGDEEQQDDILIYENDFYPLKLISDPRDGMQAVFRLHLPMEEVKEFNVPLSEINTEKFRTRLSKEGVVGNIKQMGAIMEYSIKFVKELQEKYMAEQARMQYGWADKDKRFIVGNREYDGKKWRSVPASSATGHTMPYLEPKGSLTTWKQIINALATEGLEPLQLVALAGFGAPLMRFSGVHGGTLNLLSNDSGTGKTTAGQIALSIYGQPDGLMLKENDTFMSREQRLGVMNNLPCLFDEMTNSDPRELSNLLYSITSGRGRNRLERDSNSERANNTTWSTIVITNSNASMASKLAKFKSRADGELMRLLELPVPKVKIPEGHKIFDQMHENYGVAGEIYVPWLVKNRDKLPKLIGEYKDILTRRANVDQSERFWVSIFACILVGAKIAQNLNLHDLDLKNLEKWVRNQFGLQRATAQDSVVSADSLIGEFLLEHHNQIIGVSGKINPMTGTNVFMQPRGNKVIGRFEADSRIMYITRKAFKEYCVDRQFTVGDALERAKDPNGPYVFIGHEKKRLTANTGLTTPPVDALKFECSEDEAEAIQVQMKHAELEH